MPIKTLNIENGIRFAGHIRKNAAEDFRVSNQKHRESDSKLHAFWIKVEAEHLWQVLAFIYEYAATIIYYNELVIEPVAPNHFFVGIANLSGEKSILSEGKRDLAKDEADQTRVPDLLGYLDRVYSI